MVGRSLREMREHLDALSAPDGPYELVCARTGERPFPADGRRFDDRATAEEAAYVVEQYRTALREYDPRLARHDLIVHETGASVTPAALDGWAATVEFCHDVAGATFEALSAGGFDGVERAVFDAYLAAAEDTPRDALCLALLRCTAVELGDRLTPTEQASVLDDAVTRLPRVDGTLAADPLAGALARFRSLALVTASETRTWRDEPGGRHAAVTLTDYALDDADGPRPSLPTLPLVVEYRRRGGTLPAVTDATRPDGRTWELTLALDADRPSGLCVTE